MLTNLVFWQSRRKYNYLLLTSSDTFVKVMTFLKENWDIMAWVLGSLTLGDYSMPWPLALTTATWQGHSDTGPLLTAHFSSQLPTLLAQVSLLQHIFAVPRSEDPKTPPELASPCSSSSPGSSARWYDHLPWKVSSAPSNLYTVTNSQH